MELQDAELGSIVSLSNNRGRKAIYWSGLESIYCGEHMNIEAWEYFKTLVKIKWYLNTHGTYKEFKIVEQLCKIYLDEVVKCL